MQKRLPVPDSAVQVLIELARDHGQLKAGAVYRQPFLSSRGLWTWTARQISAFARLLDRRSDWSPRPVQESGRIALQQVLEACLPGGLADGGKPASDGVTVEFTIDYDRDHIRVDWRRPGPDGKVLATGRIKCTGPDELSWEWTAENNSDVSSSTHRRAKVRQKLQQWQDRLPVLDSAVRLRLLKTGARGKRSVAFEDPPPWGEEGPWAWLEDEVLEMADVFRKLFRPLNQRPPDLDLDDLPEFGEADRIFAKRERKLAEAEERLREGIKRLDYQVRTALRVIGPLRGRALLSDEVGLGKTIEAGLVLKEYLTRGLVRRFLVLTVPSLVDQWAEELDEKFHLRVATTNDAEFRADPDAFWAGGDAVVASLHTVKQAAHLTRAQQVKWDLLIVDEAHYLRNRTSQAWQAVSLLPRQFLLLLTATPVQNSIEELYNLVTLLQPGHLPSPKEFRARYVDPKRPHRPREPDELRRLLWQVMIRNTRANAGLDLPARRAETVVFEPAPAEAEFQAEWEREFRAALGRLKTSEASLWGRLVLQAIGSSPAAWRWGMNWPRRAKPTTRSSNWTKPCSPKITRPFETRPRSTRSTGVGRVLRRRTGRPWRALRAHLA